MALNSMTAYGFGENNENEFQYSCEVKTLNSRFLEVNVRMPRQYLSLEAEIIKFVKSQLNRGKCDLFIDIQSEASGKELPDIDLNALKHYSDVCSTISNELASSDSFDDRRKPGVMDFLRLDGVLQLGRKKDRGTDLAEKHREGLFTAIKVAIDELKKARGIEGSSLSENMSDLVKQLQDDRNVVHEKRDSILEGLHQNYLKRLKNVIELVNKNATGTAEFAEERILSEVGILCDKADIDEELVRMKTHCDEFLVNLNKDEAIGRKLDFLCQEMHREVNTMSNKLLQTDVSQHTLNMKQNVERLRQQVQNIE
jgi:uncharacterized protein (TIGR00255 family)